MNVSSRVCAYFTKPSFYFNVKKLSISSQNLFRKPFKQLTNKDIDEFKFILSEDRVLSNKDELESYNTDWLKMYKGKSGLVLRPKSTEEVSKILSYSFKNNIAICPQGGNTGLVGGSVPVYDEVIVSTSLMNKIESFDPLSGLVICQPGCILQTLDDYVHNHGFVIPVSLGAKGTCQIGGNVSTAAGGLTFLRYGPLRSHVVGLEVVTPKGEVLNLMSKVRKDNTGYDLKQLFIGSEGTLGIITKLAINCPSDSPAVAIAFLGCENFDKVLGTFKLGKKLLSEVIRSFEVMDFEAISAVVEHQKRVLPIANYPFYLLVECAGGTTSSPKERMEDFLEKAMESKLIVDGTLASEPSRIQNLWEYRENIPIALSSDGCVLKYDLSLPVSDFYNIVPIMKKKLEKFDIIRCCGYGHLGDGNIHFTVCSKEFSQDIHDTIEPYVFDWTAEKQGSVSAEHGLGFKRRDCLHYGKNENTILLMKQIKEIIDPKGILNPYKILPLE